MANRRRERKKNEMKIMFSYLIPLKWSEARNIRMRRELMNFYEKLIHFISFFSFHEYKKKFFPFFRCFNSFQWICGQYIFIYVSELFRPTREIKKKKRYYYYINSNERLFFFIFSKLFIFFSALAVCFVKWAHTFQQRRNEKREKKRK